MKMTYAEAKRILDMVRNGDRSPTRAEIIRALIVTGDLS